MLHLGHCNMQQWQARQSLRLLENLGALSHVTSSSQWSVTALCVPRQARLGRCSLPAVSQEPRGRAPSSTWLRWMTPYTQFSKLIAYGDPTLTLSVPKSLGRKSRLVSVPTPPGFRSVWGEQLWRNLKERQWRLTLLGVLVIIAQSIGMPEGHRSRGTKASVTTECQGHLPFAVLSAVTPWPP